MARPISVKTAVELSSEIPMAAAPKPEGLFDKHGNYRTPPNTGQAIIKGFRRHMEVLRGFRLRDMARSNRDIAILLKQTNHDKSIA